MVLYFFTIIVGILIALFLMGIGVIGGAYAKGALGSLLGFLFRGLTSILVLIIFALSRSFFIFGAYLLNHSLIINHSQPGWKIINLIFGLILLITGLLINQSKQQKINN